MAKRLKLSQLRIGQLVAVNDPEDAQVYTIAKIQHVNVLLLWFEGIAPTRRCSQWTDYSWCQEATLAQIEYSIRDGRLASTRDIEDLPQVLTQEAMQ